MSTETKVFRPAAVQRVYVAANYADMVTDAQLYNPGDIVEVATSGIRYLVTGPEDFQPLTDERFTQNSVFYNASDDEGEAIAETNTTVVLAGTGVRVCGQGLAEDDAGAVVAYGVGGSQLALTTTDEAAHLVALSWGGNTEPWTPAASGPMEVEAVVDMDTAITDRAFFIGFVGAMADALDPVVTGSATTITLVQDDVHGLYFDSGLTDADRLFMVYNKADAAASIATTATGVDTGTDFPAADTKIRLKVRIEADGTMRCYANGIKIGERVASAATAVALSPVVYVESNAAATKTMNVHEFGARSLA